MEYNRRLAAGGTEMIWAENFVRIFLPYKNVTNGNIDEFADEQVRQLIDAIHAQGAKCGTQTDIMGSAFYGEVPARGGRDVQYFTLGERLHGGFLRGGCQEVQGLGPQEQHATQFLGDLHFDTRGGIGSASFGGQALLPAPQRMLLIVSFLPSVAFHVAPREGAGAYLMQTFLLQAHRA